MKIGLAIALAVSLITVGVGAGYAYNASMNATSEIKVQYIVLNLEDEDSHTSFVIPDTAVIQSGISSKTYTFSEENTRYRLDIISTTDEEIYIYGLFKSDSDDPLLGAGIQELILNGHVYNGNEQIETSVKLLNGTFVIDMFNGPVTPVQGTEHYEYTMTIESITASYLQDFDWTSEEGQTATSINGLTLQFIASHTKLL